jgi:hypothetical protein
MQGGQSIVQDRKALKSEKVYANSLQMIANATEHTAKD